jgi:N-acetyl-gamma-glutamyl-phosphate reductase
MKKVAIIGASGYAGIEALRLIDAHPQLELGVVTADSQAGQPIAALYPHMAARLGTRVFDTFDPSHPPEADAAIIALPHGHSMDIVERLLHNVGVVVDVGADFRLADPAAYERWYGHPHRSPHLLEQALYSIPEFCRDRVRGARLVANPGCYPTAASIAMTPLVRGGLIEPGTIVVDAASGVSGAGRPPKPNTTFCTVDEDFTAYGLLDHRHTPEMEQVIGSQVLFTPHLVPMSRGILATCYGRVASQDLRTEDVLAALDAAYHDEPFVVSGERIPNTKATFGSNLALVTARVDPRTGWVVSICAIDNLVKGAAGQAVQNLNLALGLDETLGLPAVAVYP